MKRAIILLLIMTICLGLLSVSTFAEGEEFEIDENGVLVKYNGPGGDVVIPESVTKIGNSAFSGCSNLKTVQFSSRLQEIGNSAFWGTGLTDVYYEGDQSSWSSIQVDNSNDLLLNATIHYNTGGTSRRTTAERTFPEATQYVPYRASIPAVRANSSFVLTSGRLPDGLNLSEAGVISGMSTELGVFNFKVTETYEGGSTEYTCTLSVYSRMYANVEANNQPGYGFVETETDDGHVQDQIVASREELTDQTMHCEATFSEFRGLYLDARLLTRDKDYTAEAGSTKITISAETIGDAGGGTHTLAAEFVTGGGEHVYTVQNYTVAGIASKEVHVQVSGSIILWTASEP